MLQDAIWANTEKLESDKAYQDQTAKFLEASFKGWIYCRDNAEACRDIVVARGSKLGASHQLWQMNEINKLVWPSPDGIGMVDEAAWDQTVDDRPGDARTPTATRCSPRRPRASPTRTSTPRRRWPRSRTDGDDVTGDGFEPIEVQLKEGGA